MNSRHDIVNQIMDLTNCDRDTASITFDVLRRDERIHYTDDRGLVLADDIDLLNVIAHEVTGA